MKYLQTICVLAVFFLTSCDKEEEIHFETLTPQDKVAIEKEITGNTWVHISDDLQISDMAIYNNSLYFGSNNILNRYSGDYDGEFLNKHIYRTSYGSSEIETIKVFDSVLYSVGLAGDYGFAKFDNKYRTWIDLKYVNTNAHDFVIHDDIVFIGTSIMPYIRMGALNAYGFMQQDNDFDKAVYSLTIFNNRVIAGGAFSAFGEKEIKGVAKWNGTEWISLGNGIDGVVYSMIEYNGNLIAGGNFEGGIVEWDGVSWKTLGEGLLGGYNNVLDMRVHANELYIAGDFQKAGKVFSPYIAKWTGSAWESIGGGAPDVVEDIEIFDNKLYISKGAALKDNSDYFMVLE